jgi:hypothetical protein
VFISIGFVTTQNQGDNTTTRMISAMLVIVINIVTDIVPYISILEIKFIELFKKSKEERDLRELDNAR